MVLGGSLSLFGHIRKWENGRMWRGLDFFSPLCLARSILLHCLLHARTLADALRLGTFTWGICSLKKKWRTDNATGAYTVQQMPLDHGLLLDGHDLGEEGGGSDSSAPC